MKIGFTGTQAGMTRYQRDTLIGLIVLGSQLDHGDCLGSDLQAHMIALEMGLPIHIRPPVNPSKRAFAAQFTHPNMGAVTLHEPAPYLAGNQDIVRATQWLIATPLEYTEQLRSGTWSTVRFAREHRRQFDGAYRITIIRPNGEIQET